MTAVKSVTTSVTSPVSPVTRPPFPYLRARPVEQFTPAALAAATGVPHPPNAVATARRNPVSKLLLAPTESSDSRAVDTANVRQSLRLANLRQKPSPVASPSLSAEATQTAASTTLPVPIPRATSLFTPSRSCSTLAHDFDSKNLETTLHVLLRRLRPPAMATSDLTTRESPSFAPQTLSGR